MTRRPRTIVTGMALMVLAALTAVLALPAGAHTAMLRASPDRNAIAGGSVSFIDLEFLDSISDASVAVMYNGAPMPGQTTVNAGEVITFILDQPLTQPGRYQVTYEMISADGDFTTGGYFFTFDPAAAPLTRIEPTASGGSGGASSTTIALVGAGLVAAVGLIALVAWRMENRRRQRFASTTENQEPSQWHASHR